jgi:Right handed beta helix region
MGHTNDDISMGRRAYLQAGVIAMAGIGSLSAVERTSAAPDPALTDTEIGGGDGYDRTVSPMDADVIVSTVDELLEAFNDVSSGDIVYVDDDAEIDLTERRITVPAGITLASGRGRGGKNGGLITCTQRTARMLQIYDDDVRITGLRFRGSEIGYYDPSGDAWDHNSLALRAYGSCEIDNCEIYGWTHAGIGIGNDGEDSMSSDAHVHHCSIHDNMMSGLGYGVVVYRGEPLIEYNHFNGNRHSIAADGASGCSYEARYNIQGPNGLIFGFEMHSPGGERVDIHHNTFQYVENRNGNVARSVAIRGTPSEGATIEDNWFYNATDPGDNRYVDGSPVVQYDNDAGGDGWDNVLLSNNHFGEDEPAEDIGHPRNGPERAQLRVYVREAGVETDYLEGATVGITPHDGTDMSRYDGSYLSSTRDEEDYFGTYALFEGLPVGNYDIFAIHPEYEDNVYTDLELGSSGRQPPIVLEPREEPEQIITISGRGRFARYEFTVSGTVEKSTADGATINSYDSIDESVVTGRTTNEPDSYEFTGEITSFEASSGIEVMLNGERVDPSEL